MIVYASTKSEFRQDVRSNRIEEIILEAYQRNLGHSTSKSEIDSWKNSMMYMSNVLDDDAIPDDAGVAIEYKIPQTAKRIDFILTGTDNEKKSTAVIVELKQWSSVKPTEKDGVVKTVLAGAEREVSHPSYQAWTYAALLEDYNEAVQEQDIALNPCAYLHNLETGKAINDSRYSFHLKKAPSFIRSEAEKLTAFIRKFIRYGDAGKALFEIDNGNIKPSKNLADKLLSMLKGNEEFYMVDDQKLVFETAMNLAQKSSVKNKHVLIVEGGPGTGKSVVAINLLVKLTNKQLVTQYVTKNAAPRAVYESVLTGSFTKSHISNLFSGSGAYTDCEKNIFDALIIDEAHRLNEKSGMYQNMGENQIKELIQAAKFSIFFVDDDQRVTWKDIGEKKVIEQWAKELGASVNAMELQSQFRCNGSDGYLAWLDIALQIKETANESLEGIDYEFKIFDSPQKLRDAIVEKNKLNNRARLVAGYCWDWVSKKPENKAKNDIVFHGEGFAMQWNLSVDGSLWIRKPESVNEVGCIHTCQGLELDFVGVIVGPDMLVRDGRVITDAAKRSRMDSSIKGYKKLLKENPGEAKARADSIIKNTYRTLMTRGQKGCYIYCTDPETNAYFKTLAKESLAHENVGQQGQSEAMQQQEELLPFRILPPEEAKPYENCVPLYDLEIAAGQFSDEQSITEVRQIGDIGAIEQYQWVELPEVFRPQRELFVAKVLGESMNRRIPNGSWCLFKFAPGGTRQGKIVLVQHRDIYDSDTGGHYTIKLYESKKIVSDTGEWEHSQILLKPETNKEGYEDIILDGKKIDDLEVIAEFIAVL